MVKTIRPSVLLSDLVPPARIPSNPPRKDGNYKGYNRGEPSKTIKFKMVIKPRCPKSPEAVLYLSEINKKPVKLLYCNMRQSCLLYCKENNRSQRKMYNRKGKTRGPRRMP
jgi:hypothetical protein